MLTDFLNDLSDFLLIDRSIIPNVLTLIVYVTITILALKGGVLDFIALLIIYLIASTVLSLLGIESVFNVIDMILNFIDDFSIWDLFHKAVKV
jgi:hypothetical protein